MIAVRKSGIPKADALLLREGRFYLPFNRALTDSGRGAAALAAVDGAESGDCIDLAVGDFDLGNNQLDLSLGGTGTVHLFGKGRNATRIASSIKINTGTEYVIIHPGLTGCEVADLSIIGSLVDGSYQGPWGTTLNQSAFTGAILRNVYISGQSDGVYIRNASACSATIQLCKVVTSFDAYVHIGSGTGDHQVDIYASHFEAVGPNLVSTGMLRTVTVSTGSVRIHSTTIIATNGGDVEHAAVRSNGGNVYLYSGRAQSTNTGSATAYDLKDGAGTLNVNKGGFIYDSAKTTGTITQINGNLS